MLKNIVIGVLAISIIGCEKTEPPKSEPALTVRGTFNSFKAALEEGNGKQAVGLVTPSTIEMYEKCRGLALDSSGVDFEVLSNMEVILVFQLRWSLSKARLELMTGEDVFVWGVDEGLIDKKGVETIELAKVQQEGDRAFVTLTNQGKPVPGLLFYFEIHGNNWKFNLRRLMQGVDASFEAIRQQSGKTKIELAVFLLEQTFGKQVPVDILNGPLK